MYRENRTEVMRKSLSTLATHPKDKVAWGEYAQAASHRAALIRRGRQWDKLTQPEAWLLYVLYDAASRAGNMAVALAPKDSDAWAKLAGYETFAGHNDRARAALFQSISLDPGNRTAFRWGLQMFQPKWGGTGSDKEKHEQKTQQDTKLFESLAPEILGALRASAAASNPG